MSGSPHTDSSTGQPPPSLALSNLDTHATTFGSSEKLDSLYLSNPSTIDFQDGTIEFDILFDGPSARAAITFRMLDSNNYYAAILANAWNWPSNFVMVKNGIATAIGNASAPQEFPTGPNSWSHVVLNIRGSLFSAYRDGVEIFSAYDTSWREGKWGGIGIYAAYFDGAFHIDNFSVYDTSVPLMFRALSTEWTTVFNTSVVSTSVTVASTVSTASTTTFSTNVTYTSTIIHSRLIADEVSFNALLLFFGLGHFIVFLLGAAVLKRREIIGALLTYILAVWGFILYASLNQGWITQVEMQYSLLAVSGPTFAGLASGWYLKHRNQW